MKSLVTITAAICAVSQFHGPMTNAQYKALLQSCNFRDPDQVSKLVTSSHTEIRFNKKVQERQLKNPAGASNYFTGFFGTETWPDGQGQTMEREFYTDPYLPVTFSHFVKTMQVCDPNLANECHTDYCEIPEGGRGSLGHPVMYKAGFKTPRDCIANIRHIDSFWYWAKKAVAGREKVDEQVTNLFGTFAILRTLGHKFVLQAESDGNGELVPIANANPRNPFGMFAYNYMSELFPRATDLNKIVPLSVDLLQVLARRWAQFPEGNEVAVGSRGEKIYEFWYPDDWYMDAVIQNPDYMEKMKILYPSKMFAGYSLAPTSREVIENWAMRSMPWLPRFTQSTEGGLIMVDTHEGVDIEVGKEWIGGREFLNAPFGLAVLPTPNQGTFLTRPALTQSGAGLPIMPITGDGGWRIRNDYDKDCNPDLNQPYAQKRFEMGFMPNSPAGVGIIYRRRKLRLQAVNTCDFMPIFQKAPNTVNCTLTTIGCEDNKRRASDNIMESGSFDWVECSSGICGNGETGVQLYWIKVERSPGDKPDRNFLGCECGATVMLAIHDEDGAFVRQVPAVLKDNRLRWPYDWYWVQTTEANMLEEGECIKGIMCSDGTPLQGNVLEGWDNTVPGHEDMDDDTVLFFLDSPIDCEVGGTVKVHYFDEDSKTLGIVTATITEANHERNEYLLTGSGLVYEKFAGQVAVGVSCAGGGSNSTSSSSSSSSSLSSSSSSSSSSSAP
jgi:hypothetical protein